MKNAIFGHFPISESGLGVGYYILIALGIEIAYFCGQISLEAAFGTPPPQQNRNPQVPSSANVAAFLSLSMLFKLSAFSKLSILETGSGWSRRTL